MNANPDFIAIFAPYSGMYYLKHQGKIITDDGAVVWLDRPKDCEIYVKRHYGQNLTHWQHEKGAWSLSKEKP